MKVMEMMVKNVQSCSVFDNLNGAAQLMWENDCGVVPVVEPDGRVVGMLTDRDICMGAYTKGRTLISIPVGEVMSHDVQTCRAEDELSDVAATMSSRRLRRLPVVDESERLVGIVSLNDIARRAVLDRNRRSKGMPGLESIAETLAAICKPWSKQVEDRDALAPLPVRANSRERVFQLTP